MGNFENTLKYIIWKHFEIHHLKTIETCGRFLKTLLKHIIWKPLKLLWDFWKHFETHKFWKYFQMHHLKTTETYGEFWKHFETHFENTI